jgi:phospholipid/cholesterol/gamma-HCH transport system permease protein
MIPSDQDSDGFYKITEKDREISIHFTGKMNIETAADMLKKLQALIRQKAPSSLTADIGNVSDFDEFGAVILFELRQMMSGGFEIINTGPDIREILSHINFNPDEKIVRRKKRRFSNMLVSMGKSVIQDVSDINFLIAFIGSLAISLVHVCFHPKSLRVEDTVSQMEKTGVAALPIVALISFLLGLIMAFMSSIQFRQFGASIYVASLVAFAMVSELGPIMTAIVIAGRSGSAFAAEIGTMKISEEVDALFTMGFDPVLFLAVPRLIAAVTVVPMLALFSNIFAISGGLTVGVFILGLSPNTYIKSTLEVLTLTEVLWGMAKSGVFAMLIAGVGCLRGFQAKGGASAVGIAATSAVVSSIFLIILFDSIFAVARSYW